MYHDISPFSPPLSEHIRDGRPYSFTASRNRLRTVVALLLSDAWQYISILEYPSIPSWITILHLETTLGIQGSEKVENLHLSVIVRENRAGPKDQGWPFTFIFSQCKSYPKRLTTMIFVEAGVRFSLRYCRVMILASRAV